MKIDSDDYRVVHGKKLKLSKWPTIGKPICNSKKSQEHLQQIEAEAQSVVGIAFRAEAS